MPDGEAWYAYFVQEHTTTTMTPDEIHALGLSEVARIRGEMDQVRQQVGFTGDLAAFFDHLETDPQFYFTQGAEVCARLSRAQETDRRGAAAGVFGVPQGGLRDS